MRIEIKQLETLGPLPLESDAAPERLEIYEHLLKSIVAPLSDEEARVLTKIFGPDQDSCFGLAWKLVHLIETAPGWPLNDCVEDTNDGWLAVLRERANNGGNS